MGNDRLFCGAVVLRACSAYRGKAFAADSVSLRIRSPFPVFLSQTYSSVKHSPAQPGNGLPDHRPTGAVTRAFFTTLPPDPGTGRSEAHAYRR
jgi:hypothetical protein